MVEIAILAASLIIGFAASVLVALLLLAFAIGTSRKIKG
jgi:hypothetical protein